MRFVLLHKDAQVGNQFAAGIPLKCEQVINLAVGDKKQIGYKYL